MFQARQFHENKSPSTQRLDRCKLMRSLPNKERSLARSGYCWSPKELIMFPSQENNMRSFIEELPQTCSHGEPSFNAIFQTLPLQSFEFKTPFATPTSSTIIHTKRRTSKMHTLILIIITLLLLSLLTTAGMPRWQPPHWPPPIPQFYYWGDMLNVTKCYCEGTQKSPNPGSYYLFEYRNFHKAQVYTLGWSCDSANAVAGWGQDGPKSVKFPLPECWNGHDSWREQKRASCVRSYNADTFCFELGDKTDPHDHYYFNGQKRGLPGYGIVDFGPNRCVALCRDKLGGKTVASKCTSLLCSIEVFFFWFRGRKALPRERWQPHNPIWLLTWKFFA